LERNEIQPNFADMKLSKNLIRAIVLLFIALFIGYFSVYAKINWLSDDYLFFHLIATVMVEFGLVVGIVTYIVYYGSEKE